jgi:hypothetical protein
MKRSFEFARKMTWFFFVSSFLSFIYIYYLAEIESQRNLNEKFFKYYIISLAGILFWGGVLRLKDEIRLKITILATSLVVAIYLVEITLDFVLPTHKPIPLKGRGSHGEDAVLSVFPSNFLATEGLHEAGTKLLFPLSSVSKKTTVGGQEGGQYMIYQSDRYGFNNPDSEWDAPQTEWVLTGDSYAYGYAVQNGEDIAGQIRSITQENVINLGMGGNGPLIELAALKEYAESRKPKIVLWVYFENDLNQDLPQEKKVPLLMSYRRPEFSQKLIYRQADIDSLIQKFVEKKKWVQRLRVLRLFNIRSRIGIDRYNPHTAQLNDDDIDSLFSEILTQGRDQAAAWGGKLFFVFLPQFERYATDIENHDLYMKRGEVIEVIKSLNIPVIDIHQEVFANHSDPLSLFPFRKRGHYNAEGYSEVAKAIVSGVRNEQERRSLDRSKINLHRILPEDHPLLVSRP